MLCPICETHVWDHEPGVSYVTHEGAEYHPACLYAERPDLKPEREPPKTRTQFQIAMREGIRLLFQKHERERAAVRERDRYVECAPVFSNEMGHLDRLQINVNGAARDTDHAICCFAETIYELVKGDSQ